MIIVLVYFKDRSSRMPIYVWDELYFFKGSYSIRITQWSRQVIHRKRLFKEINMLLQERSTFKDSLTDRQRENCFLTEVESKFLPDFRIFICQVRHISKCLDDSNGSVISCGLLKMQYDGNKISL